MKWQSYKLKEVGEVVTGNTPPTTQREYYGTQYKFIKPTDMREGQRYVPITEEYYSELAYQKYRKSLLPANTPCVVTIGSLGKKMCLTDEPSFTNQAVNAVIPNENFDGEFLYYCLRTRLPYVKQLDSGTTSGRENVSKSSFSNIVIEAPSLAIQKRIASILSAYDNLIENNNKRIKILEQMAENLYKEWFVRFRFPGHETTPIENGIPKGWSEERLDQFGVVLDSGSRPSGGIDDSLNEGVPSLGAESVKDLGVFDYDDVKYIPFDFYDKMKRGKNTGKDILIYKDGAYIGKTTIFMCEFPYKKFAVNEHVFLLNALDSSYQYYLYFTLHQQEYFVLMQNLNRNAAQPGLSKPDINRIKVLKPQKNIVDKFNVFVEPLLNQIFKTAKQNQNLIKQRDLLLPRLMSGKLAV